MIKIKFKMIFFLEGGGGRGLKSQGTLNNSFGHCKNNLANSSHVY